MPNIEIIDLTSDASPDPLDVVAGQVAAGGPGSSRKYKLKDLVNGVLSDNTLEIKMKKLTGTSPATEGGTTNIAHGLILSKIIGFHVLVTSSNGNSIPPGLVFTPEFQYDAFLDATNAVIRLSGTNSGNMLSNTIVVLLIYEE